MSTSNNFDAIRLLAALGVWLSHGLFFYDGQSLSFVAGTQSVGSICVGVFFFTSGHLLQCSLQRQHGAGFFFSRRCARIFPGLWVAAVFSVFIVGGLATTWERASYLQSGQVWQVFFNYASARALEHQLPGVFAQNYFPNSVNGALWTIKYELLLYVVLYVFFRLTRKQSAWATGALLLLLATLLLSQRWPWQLGWWVLQDALVFAWAFFLGSWAAAVSVQHWPKHSLWVLAVLVGLSLYGVQAISAKTLLLMVLVGLVTIALAYHMPVVRLRHDLSYGVYIYAFPIQQWVTQMAMQQQWPKLVCLGVSLLVVLVVAGLSWRYVEQPALRWVQRYSRRWQAPAPTAGPAQWAQAAE